MTLPILATIVAQAEGAHQAAAKASEQTVDIIGHVSNGEHPLFHLPLILGIDFSITKHVFMLWVVAALIFVAVTAIVRKSIARRQLVPAGAANGLEIIVEFVRDTVVEPNVGAKRVNGWTPLLLTFFIFILGANAIGLIPIFDLLALIDHWFIHSGEHSFLQRLVHGSATATGNFNVTAGLATVTFVAIIVAGSRAHGFVQHWKNLVPHGMPWPLYILLIPLEIIGMLVRPFALTMRLAANMTGGHIALLAIMSFVFVFTAMLGQIGGIGIGLAFSVPLGVGISALEIIVVLVQAYVFTLLSAVFIGMAIHAHH
ncbi:MAG TPA: F0F1 ATP synthase subunit A [Vicinamibacterales bacterium]|nr:F0F1 ATP synthase subunit A [Vicinamibacterales bacterium]